MYQFIEEIGKKGHITYKYNNRHIYSLYDPVSEAKKHLAGIENLKKISITCCGADYINQELINRNLDLIISIEPVRFKRTVNSDRLIRVTTLSELEELLFKKNIHSKDLSIIFWPVLLEAAPEIYIPLLKSIKEILYKSSISANTAGFFGFLELRNFLINIINSNELEIINLNSAKINSPALIISSGYSLFDNIDFIRKVREKAFLFALPSSVPYLYSEKIFPDFVIAVDPGYASFYHLLKYKSPVTLITSLNIQSSILKLKNYSPVFFNYGNFLENILYQNTDIAVSFSEGSVIFNLLKILPQLGLSEFVLVGQDFGYKDNRSHIFEGNFENEFLYFSNYYNSIEKSISIHELMQEKISLNICGKEIQTNPAFKIYFDHFTGKIPDMNIKLPINAFNPISKNSVKINVEYINDNYKNKQRPDEIIKIKNLYDLADRKKAVFDILKMTCGCLKNKNLNKMTDDLLGNLFIERDNPLHLYFLKKILFNI